MQIKRVEEFHHLEFRIVVASRGAGSFVGIAYDANNSEAARCEATSLVDCRAAIKQAANERSQQFVGFPAAKRQFFRASPLGFKDPFYYHFERGYKLKAHHKSRALLSAEKLSHLLSRREYEQIGVAAKSVIINLIFPNEAMAFGSFLKQGASFQQQFAETLFRLLHEYDFDGAFDELATILKPSGAAKWTLLTYWPFIFEPDRHMFLKPEVSIECAWRLGHDFGYESYPTSVTYRRFLSFIDHVRDGIADLHPADNIDVQTLLYVIGKPGFVADAEVERAKWEVRQSAKPGGG